MEHPKIAVSGQNVSCSSLHPLRYAFALDICIVCGNKIYSFGLDFPLNYPSAVGASTAKRLLNFIAFGFVEGQYVFANGSCA